MTFIPYVRGYKYYYSKNARKTLKNLESEVSRRIDNKLKDLVAGYLNVDVKKLVDRDNEYRIRVGNYRVIYEIQENKLVILVIEITLRDKAYKRRNY